MRRKVNEAIFMGAALVCAMSVAPVHADSMRCGKWIVNESTPLSELVSKCGEPQSRDITEEDVRIINQNGASVKTGAKTVTERWIYQESSRSLPMAVVIVDGRISSITRAD